MNRPARIAVVAAVLLLLGAADLLSLEATRTQTRVTPACGRFYRPGAWLQVFADVALATTAPAGDYAVAVQIRTPEGRIEHETRLPAVHLEPGQTVRLPALVLAGRVPPVVRLILQHGPTQRSFVSDHVDLLEPLSPATRLIVSTTPLAAGIAGARATSVRTADLPVLSSALESIDLLVLGPTGTGAAGALNREQRAALLPWLVRGGVVLALDSASAGAIDAALDAGRFRDLSPAPFALPPVAEASVVATSTARRVGRGLVVDISSAPGAAQRVLAGGAVWRRLQREHFRPAADDLRLAPGRYRAIDGHWPAPPRLSTGSFVAWTLAGLGIVLGVLALPGARASVLRAVFAATGAAAAAALLFLHLHPTQEARSVHARIRVVGETGPDGPALDEDLWLGVPFEDGGSVAVEAPGAIPPRPLFADEHDMSRLHTILAREADGWLLRVVSEQSDRPVVRRQRGVLTQRHLVGPILPPRQLMARLNPASLALLPTGSGKEADGVDLHDVTLRSRDQTLRLQTLPSRIKEPVELAQRSEPTPNERARIEHLLEDEHRPERYVVLSGWEEPAPLPESPSQGTVRVQTLHRVP